MQLKKAHDYLSTIVEKGVFLKRDRKDKKRN